MSLVAVFNAVAEHLDETVSMGGPGRVADESRPPRITWQPLSSQFGPPRRLGGGPGDDGPIMTRRWHLQVDLWGVNLAATEELVDRFLAIMHRLVSPHSFNPLSERWDVGMVGDHGVLCSMVLELSAPVLRTTLETRPITAIAASYTLSTE